MFIVPHFLGSIYNGADAVFFLAVLSVLGISFYGCRWFDLQKWDALCAGSSIGFLAIGGSAVLLSLFQALNGLSWTAALAVMALMVLLCGKKWALNRGRPGVKTDLPIAEILLVLVICFPVLVDQMIRPVRNWDDLMYHGSRAGYWMTNHSVLPFPVHNDRIVAFPIGGDLFFALGVLTTHGEAAGKFLVFLAYPLLQLILLGIFRLLKVRSWLAFVSVAAFAMMPLARSAAVGIKPDLWAVVFSLAAVYWFLRAQDSDTANKKWSCLGWLGVSLACGLGVKWTILPLLLVIPLALGKNLWKRRTLFVGGLFFLTLTFGGAGPALVHNLAASGNPLGAARFREVHLPQKGWHTTSVHLRRIPFLLLDFPMFFDEESRLFIQEKTNLLADRIGATQTLQWEEQGSLPGPFKVLFFPVALRFSLLWMFVFIGLVCLPFTIKKLRERSELKSLVIIAGLGIILFFAVILQTRWQPNAQLPDRFLLPAFAIGFLIFGWVLDRRMKSGNIIFITLLGAMLLIHGVPFLLATEKVLTSAAANHWQTPEHYVTTSEFEEAAHVVGSGKSILLFASQGARDYPLFDAQRGFSNRLYPWGKADFDATRFQEMLQSHQIDAIVFEQNTPFVMLWDPPFDPAPFLRACETLPGFVRIPTAGSCVVFLKKPAF